MNESVRPRKIKEFSGELHSSLEILEDFFEHSTIWRDITDIVEESIYDHSMVLWKSNDALIDLRIKGSMDMLHELLALPETMTELKKSTEPVMQDQEEEEQDHGET